MEDYESIETFWHKDFGLLNSNTYKSEKMMAKLMLAIESILGNERQIRSLIQTQKQNFITECQSYIGKYETFFENNKEKYSSLASMYTKFKSYKKKCHKHTTRVQTDWACNVCSPEAIKNIYRHKNAKIHNADISYKTCDKFLQECDDYINTLADFTQILQFIKGISSCTPNGYQLFSPPTEKIMEESDWQFMQKCSKQIKDPKNYKRVHEKQIDGKKLVWDGLGNLLGKNGSKIEDPNPPIRVINRDALIWTKDCSKTCELFFSVGGVTKMEFSYYDEILLSINSIREFTNIKIKLPKTLKLTSGEKAHKKLTQKYDSNPIPKAIGDMNFLDFKFKFPKNKMGGIDINGVDPGLNNMT